MQRKMIPVMSKYRAVVNNIIMIFYSNIICHFTKQGHNTL